MRKRLKMENVASVGVPWKGCGRPGSDAESPEEN